MRACVGPETYFFEPFSGFFSLSPFSSLWHPRFRGERAPHTCVGHTQRISFVLLKAQKKTGNVARVAQSRQRKCDCANDSRSYWCVSLAHNLLPGLKIRSQGRCPMKDLSGALRLIAAVTKVK